MAVIREKQQFRNQRIGVVRMDTGAENYFKTIANASDQLTQIAFKEAGIQAKQKGAETAQSVKATRLRSINPETGKPEAYTAPEGFGTVAQASYEEVLDRRFVNDVDQQIKDRGRELFLKYQNDPHGVEKYDTAMTDFVAQMIEPKNNTGILNDRFKNLIKETGAAFIASTKFNLMSKRAAIVADQLRLGLDNDSTEGEKEIISVIQAGDSLDYEGGEGTNTSELIAQSKIFEQDAGLEAGILTVPQHKINVDRIYSAIPKGQLSALLNYNSVYTDNNNKTVAMNSEVALRVENAIDTGIVPDDMPNSLKPVMQSIIDSEGYNRNTSGLKTMAGELRVGLQNRERDVKEATQFELMVNSIHNPDFVNDSKDPTTKKASDLAIARQANNEGANIDISNPKNLNMVPYFTSEDSQKQNAPWKVLLARKNIISEGLELTLKRAFRLESMTKEQLQIALGHHEFLANALIGGSVVNKTLDTTLTADENAFFQTLNFITRVDGSDNIVEVAARLKENMQNRPAVNNRIKSIFSAEETESANDILNTFLGKTFGADYQMIEVVKPYVEHLAMSGVGKEDLDKQIKEMFETSYVKTSGVVVDRYNSKLKKSMFALQRLLPDYKERQAFYANSTELIQTLSGQNFVMREEDQYLGIEKNRQVKLVPMTTSAFQPDVLPIEYEIVDDLSEEGVIKRSSSLQTFQYIAHYVDDNGQLKMIPDKNGSPIFIGTELAYKDIAEMRKKQSQDEMYDVNSRTLNAIKLSKTIKARIDRNIEAVNRAGQTAGAD